MSYQVIEVDLSNAESAHELLARGEAYDCISVLKLDAGADFSVRIGAGNDAAPCVQGTRWLGDPCAPETDGLYATFSAQPGKQASLWISRSAGQLVQSP